MAITTATQKKPKRGMDGQMDVRDTTREVVQRYKEREASSGYSSSERDLPI